ncbi:MAG: lysophospholipid acyltransferase family protein [Thermoanaerobaculia bacterium]|nr:lysophospholipid acyltransferase family protein [Thermoanaerobaculia bacterium]
MEDVSAVEAPHRPGPLATFLATVCGTLFLVFGSVVFGTGAILMSWIPPRGRYSFPFAVWWARGLLLATGVRLEVVGAPAEKVAGRVVFMPNHQSLFDIPVMLVSVPCRICFLAKKSLFRIPVFGWALAAIGFVPIDRDDRSRARDAFNKAMESLDSGVSIVIYPEETRSLDGRVQPFQRGGFLMALKAGAPIVPVGIRGTFAVRPKGRRTMHPGPVEVHYGDPVDVTGIGVRERRELVQKVEAEVARLAAAPRGGEVG